MVLPAMTPLYHEPSLVTSPPPPPPPPPVAADATGKKWGPYSDAGEYGTSMVFILAGLFGGLLFFLSISAAMHFLLCRRPRLQREGNHASSSTSSGDDNDVEKQATKMAELPAAPVLVFSTTGTRLAGAGAAAECAICLTEFADGDAVRVLPACNHGFHDGCICRWLAERGSCPTCRSCCQVVAGKG